MTRTITLRQPAGVAALLRRLIVPCAICAVALGSFPVWSGESLAQQVSDGGSAPPIYWDVIGPGMDKASVSPAETRSADIVIQVLAGTDQASDALAAWIETNGINRQADGYGAVWAFDPKRPDDGWSRTARVESKPGGPVELRELIAGLTLTNYLNYKATIAAIGLRLPTEDQSEP